MRVVSDAGVLAHGVSDADDRLVAADEPLAALQIGCGGEIPGHIAIPALMEVVRKVRCYQLKLARRISARHAEDMLSAWVEVEPRADGEAGCRIILRSLQRSPPRENVWLGSQERGLAIDRHLAELVARLDERQRILAVDSDAPDLAELKAAMSAGIGEPWTSFLRTDADSHHLPMHWRLLDRVAVQVDGSQRHWRARLVPCPAPDGRPTGFELLLVSDEPPPRAPDEKTPTIPSSPQPMIGEAVAPALRQPIERIKANAETIRTRLAGPLSESYAAYASEIVAAAEHLLGLLDDLADLEVVEAEGFSTQPDHIDLAEVARQAAGILSVRARERKIAIDAPQPGASVPAIAEFRRVLQILLNLIANAISYSPEGSSIWIRVEEVDGRAQAIVADQGPGLSQEAAKVVFDKFERLGRSGDGGSGLGLYISRRLARAMGGELAVESAPGQGARFILSLPGDPGQDAGG